MATGDPHSSIKHELQKCSICGKFIGYDEFGKSASWVYVPDTHYTAESITAVHNRCQIYIDNLSHQFNKAVPANPYAIAHDPYLPPAAQTDLTNNTTPARYPHIRLTPKNTKVYSATTNPKVEIQKIYKKK